MHQPSEQLALFTFEPSFVDSVTIPRRWQKSYKGYFGEFEVIRVREACPRHRFVGRLKAQHFDFSIEISDPDGSCETVVEITAPLPCEAEAEFRYTVDKLENRTLSTPCSEVSESNLFIDSPIFTEVSNNTNDSLTFNNLVTESLVSDATSRNDSLTFNNLVTESLVSDATSRNDSLTFNNLVTESLVSDATSRNDSLTFNNLVTESLVSDATSRNDSLTFNNLVTESLVSDATSRNDSLTFNNLVTESLVSDATSRNDSLTAINIYKAKGTARGDRKYFRYSYKEAGSTKHLHIGGGNINSSVAQSRMHLVKEALVGGKSPQQIKQLIRQFRN